MPKNLRTVKLLATRFWEINGIRSGENNTLPLSRIFVALYGGKICCTFGEMTVIFETLFNAPRENFRDRKCEVLDLCHWMRIKANICLSESAQWDTNRIFASNFQTGATSLLRDLRDVRTRDKRLQWQWDLLADF